MTERADLSNDDWRMLADLPLAVATAAAVTDGVSLVGTIREMNEGVRAVQAGATEHPGNALIAAILAEMADVESAVETGVPSDAQSTPETGSDPDGYVHEVIAHAERARLVLARLPDQTETAGYNEWVLAIVDRVINETKSGGFLGIGGKRIDTDEQQFRDALAMALGANG